MGNVQQFVKHVRAECKTHGIKFVLKRSTFIFTPDKIRCVGYFDTDENLMTFRTNMQNILY